MDQKIQEDLTVLIQNSMPEDDMWDYIMHEKLLPTPTTSVTIQEKVKILQKYMELQKYLTDHYPDSLTSFKNRMNSHMEKWKEETLTKNEIQKKNEFQTPPKSEKKRKEIIQEKKRSKSISPKKFRDDNILPENIALSYEGTNSLSDNSESNCDTEEDQYTQYSQNTDSETNEKENQYLSLSDDNFNSQSTKNSQEYIPSNNYQSVDSDDDYDNIDSHKYSDNFDDTQNKYLSKEHISHKYSNQKNKISKNSRYYDNTKEFPSKKRDQKKNICLLCHKPLSGIHVLQCPVLDDLTKTQKNNLNSFIKQVHPNKQEAGINYFFTHKSQRVETMLNNFSGVRNRKSKINSTGGKNKFEIPFAEVAKKLVDNFQKKQSYRKLQRMKRAKHLDSMEVKKRKHKENTQKNTETRKKNFNQSHNSHHSRKSEVPTHSSTSKDRRNKSQRITSSQVRSTQKKNSTKSHDSPQISEEIQNSKSLQKNEESNENSQQNSQQDVNQQSDDN